MDVEELRHQIYQFNDEELFYKEQYEAREAGQFYAYIAKQEIQEVIRRHLLIPEVKETIPRELDYEAFSKWLSNCRKRDAQMGVAIKNISITTPSSMLR